MQPRGPFDLLAQNQHFEQWPTLASDPSTVVLAFPLESGVASAAVAVRQADRTVEVVAHSPKGAPKDADAAERQALATLSLDEDGTGWAAVGKTDPVIGGLQQRYAQLRPMLFHSPYEAGASMLVGHRITIAQGRKIRADMARELGDAITVAGEQFHAFPRPGVLAQLDSWPGLNATKITRLRALGEAAAQGWMTRDALRAMPHGEALAQLRTLPGVGEFFAQAMLFRGAGGADVPLDDTMTRQAVQVGYGLTESPSDAQFAQISEQWAPYRACATVLLHLAARDDGTNASARPRHRGAAKPASADG